MDRTEEEGGGEGGKALLSGQVSRLAVGAGSRLSHSPGRGRGELRHRGRVPGCAASLGCPVKTTLLSHFVPCKRCVTSQLPDTKPNKPSKLPS